MCSSVIRMSDERISELEHRSVETSQSEMQRGKKEGKHRTEYPRTVGSFQEVSHMHNWNTRRRRKNKGEKNT